MHTFDLLLHPAALVFDKCESASEMRREVLCVAQEVGQCRLNVGICWRLSAQRAEARGERGCHAAGVVSVVVMLAAHGRKLVEICCWPALRMYLCAAQTTGCGLIHVTRTTRFVGKVPKLSRLDDSAQLLPRDRQNLRSAPRRSSKSQARCRINLAPYSSYTLSPSLIL